METDNTIVSTPGANEAAEPQHRDTRMQRGTEMSEQDSKTEDTSTTESPDIVSDTDTAEPEVTDDTAETADNEQDITSELIAGKFKSQDDLIKAYKEAETFITKSKELEKTVETLNKQLNERTETEKAARIEEAKNRGFNSVEEQEIADKTILREFELYANNINSVQPEHYETARDLLQAYYDTADKRYLNEAKKLFSADFVEQVAIDNASFKNSLEQELNRKNFEQMQEQRLNLYSQIEEKHKDFLADVLSEEDKRNSAKTNALVSMFNLGAIKTTEDMDAFVSLYNSIAQQAIKDHLAQSEGNKQFNALKEKAQIPTGGSASSLMNNSTPTYEDIANMSQEQFNAAVDKYGLESIIKAS